MAGRIENLKPWPKGVSGNPSGRPRRDLSAEIARAVFERNPELIYRAMLKAFEMDMNASISLAERIQRGRRRVAEMRGADIATME